MEDSSIFPGFQMPSGIDILEASIRMRDMKVDGKKALEVLDKANNAKANGLDETALSLYSEYLSMVDPSFTQRVWLSMAEIFLKSNRLQEALVHTSKALEVMKDYLPALELKKEILKLMGLQNEAKEIETLTKRLDQEEQAKWDDPNHYYHYK